MCVRLLDVVEDKFYDDSAYFKTRAQMHEELAGIAAAFVPKEGFEKLVAFKVEEGGRNTGNEMTQDLKWLTKYHRSCGVHVTPTCFMNGIEAGQISSGWTLTQWQEFFTPFIRY